MHCLTLPQLLLDGVCGYRSFSAAKMTRVIAAILMLASCTALDPTPSTRPALYFPGGGLYYWWQAGVVERLQRSDHASPVCGASAGALAATLYKCDVDMDRARDLALELSTPLLDRGALGLIGRWGPVVRSWLEELLPMDASKRCSDLKLLYLRRNRVYYRRKAVSYTHLTLPTKA